MNFQDRQQREESATLARDYRRDIAIRRQFLNPNPKEPLWIEYRLTNLRKIILKYFQFYSTINLFHPKLKFQKFSSFELTLTNVAESLNEIIQKTQKLLESQLKKNNNADVFHVLLEIKFKFEK